MSKRGLNTSGGNNTLLSYFTRSPSTPKGDKSSAAKVPESPLSSKSKTPTTSKSAKKIFDIPAKKPKKEDQTNGSSDDDEMVKGVTKGRKRLRIVDSDSESSDSDRENESDNSQKMEVDKVKKPTKSTSSDSKSSKKIKIDSKMNFEEKLKANIDESRKLCDIDENSQDNDIIDIPTVYKHNTYSFLKPDKIMDAKKRRPSDPNYDPTTLYVPEDHLNSLTPAMRQWWVIKSQNYDSVLFFKVGKFYELYHMDAEVGVRELGFTFMRGDFAHSGFPEQSFDRMSTSLVERGYKVARIEQTETPDGMQERVKKMNRSTKFDKVVSREVCQIVNKGTQVFGQQIEISNEYESHFMLAIAERVTSNGHRYGVAFIDTSIGEFHIGEFDDDRQCSRLLTLIAHNPPVLVLNERGKISTELQQIYKAMLSNTMREQLLPDTQFWTAEKTLKTLWEKYFSSTGDKRWPETIRALQDDADHLGLTAKPGYQLGLKALGACLWYLTKCVIDLQIMDMARFSLYTPVDVSIEDLDKATAKIAGRNFNKYMVLDSITLSNLKIVGGEKSLFNTLDQCCTKFGKRLLNYWVCSPSCDRSVIVERQDAVKELMEDPEALNRIREIMATLPDLERQLAQIHTFGNKNRLTNHPDGRAVLFEQHKYNKKKIQDLVCTINGFNALVDISDIFKNCSSKLLKRLTQTAPNGEYPEFKRTILHFKNGFDFEEALKNGVIAPAAGVDAAYDSIQEQISQINSDAQKYLIEQEKFFGCRLQYVGNDKKRFEIEVPESCVKRADDRYNLEGQRKGAKPVRRFSTEETRQFLKDLIYAEDQRNVVLKDLMRRMFEKFSHEYNTWKMVTDSISQLDCLTALAVYGQNQNEICFPDIVDNENGPVIEFENSYYPCMAFLDDFIPNSITLGGGTTAQLALLTGPNMGGKSTLMRQVGLLCVMTQIGAPIPATSARISLIDRIFTRLGAQDDILAGQSTFLVELNETSAILKHATVNSLVLLDELGRGTATYDGTAIAASVVDFLAELKCRTLFSTHYHNLVDNFHDDRRISLGHMACQVENEKDAEVMDDPTQETVTFLYKYTDGACPKSYGFNAAKLAGLDKEIIKRGHQYSKKMELIALKRKLFAKVMSVGGNAVAAKDIKELISKISSCTV